MQIHRTSTEIVAGILSFVVSVGNNRLPACPRQANFDPGRQLFRLACAAGQVTFC